MNEDQVKGKAKQAEGQAQESWGDVKEKADETWEEAKDKLDDLGDKIDEMKDKVDRDDDDEGARGRRPPGRSESRSASRSLVSRGGWATGRPSAAPFLFAAESAGPPRGSPDAEHLAEPASDDPLASVGVHPGYGSGSRSRVSTFSACPSSSLTS